MLLLFLVPPALAVWTYLSAGSLGARPINDLVHRSGYWALLFILLSLLGDAAAARDALSAA